MRSSNEWFSRTIQMTWSYRAGAVARHPHGFVTVDVAAAAAGPALCVVVVLTPAATATSKMAAQRAARRIDVTQE